jgi:hypothetical protein
MKRTSDEKIMEIYQKDATAFRQVADQRGERIPAGVMNLIVWKFLQVYETLGEAMVDEHRHTRLRNMPERTAPRLQAGSLSILVHQ